MARLAALIARTESSFEEEARTCALNAIKLMKREGILPEDLMAMVDALKKKRRKRYRVTPSYFSERGKSGGRARADALTPEQRSDIARRAAAARWHGKRQRLP
jgi:hypothetical protein